MFLLLLLDELGPPSTGTLDYSPPLILVHHECLDFCGTGEPSVPLQREIGRASCRERVSDTV